MEANQAAARRGLIVAGVTSASGFGTLYILSKLINVKRDLPGISNYRSAIWGDSLLLPIALGSFTFAFNVLPGVRADKLVGLSAAVAGVALGVTTQVQWLRDDSPRLNWTFPEPHHFNVAGWYHAAFLAAVSGAYAGLWISSSIRYWAGGGSGLQRRLARHALLVALLASLVFLKLLVVDNRESAGTAATRATTSAIMVAVAATVGTLAFGAVASRRNPNRR